jgi:C4-type Zn-finger protein
VAEGANDLKVIVIDNVGNSTILKVKLEVKNNNIHTS